MIPVSCARHTLHINMKQVIHLRLTLEGYGLDGYDCAYSEFLLSFRIELSGYKQKHYKLIPHAKLRAISWRAGG